VYNNDV